MSRTTPIHQTEASERARRQARAHYVAHPEWYHAKNLRRFYGLSGEEYDAMLVAQCGRCWICGEAETRRNRAGGRWRLSVDHDHATRAVRGLLCLRCNNGVDRLERGRRASAGDPVLLARTREYLARYGREVPA